MRCEPPRRPRNCCAWRERVTATCTSSRASARRWPARWAASSGVMQSAIWSVVIGLLLIFLALSGTVLSRLPLSTAMLYLGVGTLASPWGLDLMRVDMGQHMQLLERMTEFV